MRLALIIAGIAVGYLLVVAFVIALMKVAKDADERLEEINR